MKVTAFCGSPRKGGNTEVLSRAMLEGAESRGAEIVFRNLNSMGIRGCQGCGWCNDKETEFCIQQDGMQTIYEDIRDSDALIIGSPIYMWQMTSQLKAMVDRLYGTLMGNFDSKIGPRKMALVFTQGAPDEVFKTYTDSTAAMFRFMKFDVADVFMATGKGAAGSAGEDTDLMNKAFDTGASLLD
ncbi:MAG: flavodoxin family protein [Candidatus Sabulitectum sp.]|nr:flavodoxin family protein [Candidatus Sabulitectum sp.]